MHQNIYTDLKNQIQRNKRRSVFKRAVSILACTVMFCTTYALILPAITMEQATFCGVEEHTHGEECYGTAQQNLLICNAEHLDIHTHSASCYDPEGNPVCGLCDYVAHSHDSSCYSAAGELVCSLPERSVHVHADSCYVPGETLPEVLHAHSDECNVLQRGDLICTLEEQDGHAHGDACYEPGDVLLCTKQENHIHTDSCYETPLVCTQSTQPHVHGADCYGRGSLICTTAENHVHGDGCRETVCICENTEEDHSHSGECHSSRIVCALPENHSHSDACYESIVVCGKAEGECHSHNSGCYGKKKLICTEDENHVHSGSCYEPRLICTSAEIPGHAHSDDCYEQITVIGCGLNEGEAEPTEPVEPVLVCTEPVAQVHVHGDGCFETVTVDAMPICGNTDSDHVHEPACYELNCGLEEHVHNTACYSDPDADLETPEQWEASFAQVELTGDWNEDVLAIARTQLGYVESTNNYVVWEDGTTHGYTRYGDWYGSPHGDWCAMFVSFCLHYAEVEGMPLHWGVRPWIEELTDLKLYHEAEVYDPKPGDLIFYDWEGDDLSDHVGFVAEIIPATEDDPAQLKALEGNSSNCVQYVYYDIDDSRILGYSELPDNPEIYSCGLLRHSHNEYCYDDADNFICQQIEHIHTDVCEPRDILFCGLEIHTHGDSCFNENGELVCEIPEHAHTDACYIQDPAEEEETEPTYYCALEEHIHGDSCFDENSELICEIPEHTHSEACTAEPVAPTYYCGLEEHTHSETCYNEAGELVCEIPEHTHNEECTAEPVTYYCGLEEHTHSETCYNEAGELVCEIPEHTHNEECTTEPVTYYCGLEEHTHSETCYNEAGELVCEIPEHTHNEECTTEPVTYYCFKQEHTHIEVCYDEAGNLLCQVPEHTHTDECTKIPVYLCGMEEHAHGTECYDETGNLICQLHEHTHSEQCIIAGGYICGMTEHTHNENCYDAEGNFICTLEEHTHTDACKAQNAYACGLTEHTHGDGCFDEEGNLICQIPEHIHSAACVGRNLYYSDMQIRVHAVIRGVEDLPKKLALAARIISEEENSEVVDSVQMAVSREVNARNQLVNATRVVDLQLISDGQIYELPETAIVTVTMEFTDPIFAPEDVENAESTTGYIVVPENGMMALPQLTVEEEEIVEEIPAEPQPEETPNLIDSVVDVLSNAFNALAIQTEATELEPSPEESGEEDPVENPDASPYGFQASAVGKQSYGNPTGGITSITFETNQISTFAVALANDPVAGNYWKRVNSLDEIVENDENGNPIPYMIVSAEGNLALTGNTSDNSTFVQLDMVKGNPGYYYIKIGNVDTTHTTHNAGCYDDNNKLVCEITDAEINANKLIRWTIKKNNSGYQFHNIGNADNNLSLSNTNSIIGAANNLNLTCVNQAYSNQNGMSTIAWRIQTPNNTSGYLKVTNAGGNFTRGGISDTGGLTGLGVSGRNTDEGNLLIFKLVQEALVIPADVTDRPDSVGTGTGTTVPKPSKTGVSNVSDAMTGEDGTAVTGKDTDNNDISVVGSYYSDKVTSNIEDKFRIQQPDFADNANQYVLICTDTTDGHEHNVSSCYAFIGSTDYYNAHSANNGKVLTDKSVVYGNDNYGAFTEEAPANTFSVTLSALGQGYQLQGEEEVTIPVDVVFVLDTSGSMYEHGTRNNERLPKLIDAANASIQYILNKNSNNRVGVAVFSSGAGELLPLGRYTAVNGKFVEDNGSHVLRTVSGLKVEGTNDTTYQNRTVSGLTDGGTFTQAGIQAGYNIFADVADADTKFTFTLNGEEKSEPRQPVFILLSDGEPTHCTNMYKDPLSGPYYGSADMGVENNAKGIMGYYTVLSANYFKDMVSIKYQNPCYFYTIGMGIQETGSASSESANENDYYKRAVLEPTAARMNDDGAKFEEQTSYMMRDLLNEEYPADYVPVENGVRKSTFIIQFDAGTRYTDSNSAVPVLHDHPYSGDYNYADKAYFVPDSLDAGDLETTFNEILDNSLKVRKFGFLLYKPINNMVTFEDKIGEGMEVEGAPKLRYDGVTYEHTNTSTVGNVTTYVYDYDHAVPYSSAPKDLSTITVTVTNEADGTQTVKMVVPDGTLPIYMPEENNSLFYYEALPVRLIYQVGLTAEAEAEVLELKKTGGTKVFYTNQWSDDNENANMEKVADSVLLPDIYNPFYFNTTNSNDPNYAQNLVPDYVHEDEPKGEDNNPTSTYENAVSCHHDTEVDPNNSNNKTIEIHHWLGNNGKLVFNVEKQIVDLPVKKVWDNRVTNVDSKEISVALYKVTETTSETGTVQTAEPVETVTLNSEADWKHTFADLDAPTEEFFYAIVETDSDGFLPTYSGGEIIEITVDNGSPVKAVKVDSAFFNTETEEDAEIPVITITNVPGVELPKTGGPGTILYTTGGLLLIAAAIFLLFYNRKSQISRP